MIEESSTKTIELVDPRLVSTRFLFEKDVVSHNPSGVSFDRMESPFYEGTKWAVRRGGTVLAKGGNWEYEPIPSSRDQAFYDRCRFDSLKQALEEYDKSEQTYQDLRRMFG